MWIDTLPMTSCVHPVQATLTLSHDDMLRDKLNLDAYITETLFGPVLKARPNNTVDFLGHFSENVFHLERNSTKSNKLGHVLGAALTSLPIGEGGVNPYNFVPSCITNAGSHLYHDEVGHLHTFCLTQEEHYLRQKSLLNKASTATGESLT